MFFDFAMPGTPASRTDRHRLAGTVTVDGVPAKRLVAVFTRDGMAFVAATWSNAATGTWEIYGLPQYLERQLVVLALDNTGNYNAEVADYVSQVTA